MTDELTMRPATAGDLDALVTMNQQLIADQRHDNPASTDQLHRRMATWIAGRYSYQVRVFEFEGRIAAYAVAREDDDGIYLRQFFVGRSLRRSGLGRRAMGLLEQEWGRREIKLDALLNNQRALDFWRALGFADYSLVLRKPLMNV